MFDNYERKLHKCIAKFIKRANKDYPDWSESRDNGEWEIGDLIENQGRSFIYHATSANNK